MAEKPGKLARDQLEPWTVLAKPWTVVVKPWTVERGDLISGLALSSLGGTFPKCKCLIGDKRRSLLTIHATRLDEGYVTNNGPISLQPP